MNFFYSFIMVFLCLDFVKSQDLNATVIVNYDRVNSANISVYKDLEKNSSNFLNNTKWTKNSYESFEKIECTFRFNIISFQNNKQFKANLQVQSSRPVYGSIFSTPLLNIQDDKISFNYTENQQLLYNNRNFSGNNLTEILAFYTNLIIGFDSDTFEFKGGTDSFNLANQVAEISINQGFDGWDQDGSKSRTLIIKNILSQNLSELRNIWYEYHKDGLDNMYIDPLRAKNNIYNSLVRFNTFTLNNTNIFNIQDYFLFLKQDEIEQIFSEKLKNQDLNMLKLVDVLKKVAPTKAAIWNKLQ
ncbi:MAG: DUF4835 family protein [Solirubrobacteraceae bacterium]